MPSRSVTVANKLGLHARAAAKFVHLASAYRSQVKISRGSQTMDGKSIMGILLLAPAKGTLLTVSTTPRNSPSDFACAAPVPRISCRRSCSVPLRGEGGTLARGRRFSGLVRTSCWRWDRWRCCYFPSCLRVVFGLSSPPRSALSRCRCLRCNSCSQRDSGALHHLTVLTAFFSFIVKQVWLRSASL